MTPLDVVRAADPRDAVRLATGGAQRVAYCAGGTTVVDLMKLGVLAPDVLVDLLPLRGALGAVAADDDAITLGALARMSEVADHPAVQRRLPAVAAALRLAASAQLRNAATIGGNLLQRTRCTYFRDLHSPCAKRTPGSSCSAIGGHSRGLAVLGTSDSCIANYPGDLAVALVALDARVRLLGPAGAEREIPVEDLHRLPGDRPDLETTLRPGELVTAVVVPDAHWPASVYVKVRDRASYAFALTSAAAALRLGPDGRVADVRIALGGLAAKPWRCREAEAVLRGHRVDEAAAARAADLALQGARTDPQRRFAVELGRRTVVRALLDARARTAPAPGTGAARDTTTAGPPVDRGA